MMSFIWWLIVGLVVGAIARLIMPGRDSMGLIATIVLGIAGSFLGGFVSQLIMGGGNKGFHPAGLVMSLVGAILLLWIWRMIRGRSSA